MIVALSNFHLQNIIFFVLLFLAVILTFRRRKDQQPMSVDSTTELKGLAILAIVITHVGYSLVSDYHFLWPLSNWSGVGVDLFLFLSAFGLTLSALKKDLSILQFYKKRLSKVLIPVWVVLIVLLLFDKVFLHLNYPLTLTWQNFLGWFPQADILHNINSPLWFITPLLFYYLFFPIIFVKKIPEVTAILFYLLGVYLLQIQLPVAERVKELWTLHYLAFPLGILFASLFWRWQNQLFFSQLKEVVQKFCNIKILKYLLLLISIGVWVWLFKYSWSLKDPLTIQIFSLLSLLLTVFIFIIKPWQSQFLWWLGVYSFEIYLLHWPLMYRYDFLFRYFPASVAVFGYLVIFILIGFLVRLTRSCFK